MNKIFTIGLLSAGIGSLLHADVVTVFNTTPFDVHAAIYYQNGPAERITEPMLIRAGQRVGLERPARRFWYDRQIYMSVNDDQLKKNLTKGETDTLSSFNIGSLKGSSFSIVYDYNTGKFIGYNPLEKRAEEVAAVLKTPAVALTKEIRTQLQKQYRPYPHEGQQIYVRSATPIALSAGERTARQERDKITLATIRQLIGESIREEHMPRIAFCASGGGIRSTIATLGALGGAQDAGIVGAFSYMVGVSGGAWAIAALATTTLTPHNFVQQFSQRVSRGVLSDVVMSELLTILWRKVAFNQPVSSIDIYGALITQRVLGWYTKDLSKLTLSAQRVQAERGNIPYPIYSALTTKEIPYRWIEFTPHEIGSEYLGAFIPSYALGTPFSGGSSMPLNPEEPLSFLMGTWGSAYSANFQEIVREVTKKITAPILTDFLAGAVTPEEIGRIRLWPSKVPNFTRGILNAPRASQELLTLIDAGIDFNIPIPPLLRADRGIDIILVIDNSDDVSMRRGAELEKAAAYAQRHKIPFPLIDKKKLAAITPTNPVAVFEGNGGPIVIYLPLIKNARSSFDPSVCIESGPCSTYNFQYTPAQTMGLASVPGEAMKDIKPILLDAIRRVVARKKK